MASPGRRPLQEPKAEGTGPGGTAGEWGLYHTGRLVIRACILVSAVASGGCFQGSACHWELGTSHLQPRGLARGAVLKPFSV